MKLLSEQDVTDIGEKVIHVITEEMRSRNARAVESTRILASVVASSCASLATIQSKTCFASQCMMFLSFFTKEAAIMKDIINAEIEAKHGQGSGFMQQRRNPADMESGPREV